MSRLLYIIAIFQITSQVYAELPSCDQFKETKPLVDAYYKSTQADATSIKVTLTQMLKEPEGASCWLVRDLKKISQDKLTAMEVSSTKTIWALRGLQFLTNCTSFNGVLRHKLTMDPQDIRWQLLLYKGVGEVPFFRTWMSRDIVVVAPIEVQDQIIEAWQSWYLSTADKFTYQQCSNMDDWYF